MKKTYATYRLSPLCGSQKGREFSIPARLIRKGSDPILNSVLEEKISFKRGDPENNTFIRSKMPYRKRHGSDTEMLAE